MRLKSVRIQNFRSFSDQTIEFGDYTALVGANGSGKSNIIQALNLFFSDDQSPALNTSQLTEEDFHCKNTDEPITITLTFTGLAPEAQKDLSHYYRQGELTVSAVAHYDPQTRSAPVKRRGHRRAVSDFGPFFKAFDAKAKKDELVKIYEDVRKRHSALAPPTTIDGMCQNLRDFEENNPSLCTDIPSEASFYGASRGKNLMENHIQWVYVPAVKELSVEDREGKDTALGRLLAKTVRDTVDFDQDVQAIAQDARSDYEDFLSRNQSALDDLSQRLSETFGQWAHPDTGIRLQWAQDPESAVRINEPFAKTIATECQFEGELPRFGHGFQRAYLLAVLQVLSESDTSRSPTLILACEEPELYQHPPQARHLHGVLTRLAGQNTQVLLCTHSPYFVSGQHFEDIRLLRKKNAASVVSMASAQDVADVIANARAEAPPQPRGAMAKIHQALQPELNEMFFARSLVFVEGLEDLAYITTYLALLGLWEDLRQHGCHIVPAGGKNRIIHPLAIANSLHMPSLVVFDADNDAPEQDGIRTKHEKDNLAILALCSVTNPDPFPTAIFWADRAVCWPTNITGLIKHEVGNAWSTATAQSETEFGQPGDLQKNALHIARSLEIAWEAGAKSASLQKLSEKIVDFAAKHA